MKFLLFVLGWCALFLVCWPLALMVVLAIPILWLLWLPFRILGIGVGAVLALLRAILYLPARLLGYREAHGAGVPRP